VDVKIQGRASGCISDGLDAGWTELKNTYSYKSSLQGPETNLAAKADQGSQPRNSASNTECYFLPSKIKMVQARPGEQYEGQNVKAGSALCGYFFGTGFSKGRNIIYNTPPRMVHCGLGATRAACRPESGSKRLCLPSKPPQDGGGRSYLM
jgi:hypothetical protein